MNCDSPRTIHTIGHSTRTTDVFMAFLKAHGIHLLVDVRRWPTSKRVPHFKREAMSDWLGSEGIDYLWRGDLGGFRKPAPGSLNGAWKSGAFQAYADFMLTAEFDEIILGVEKLAGEKRMAIMCAEAVPWRCHRQLLADAFLVREWNIRHIFENRCEEHKLPFFARPEGKRILYPSP